MKHTLAYAIAALAATGAHAATPNYPSKPVRFIVPQPAGGTSDILARLLAQKLSDSLGQQVVVDNRAGASGTIGTDLAAKAPADGYTIVFLYTTHTTTPSLYAKLPYDPINDFAPVSLVTFAPLLLVVHPTVQATSVKDLIALAKAKPGSLNFCSAGNGSGSHLAGELFKVMTGTSLTHVPYRGSPPAITDLLGGQVQLMFAGIVPIDPHVKSGRVRGIAVSSAKRSSAVPQFPTFQEAGLPGFEVVGWYGVLAPAKTPQPILDRLTAELRKIQQTPEFRDRLKAEGAEPVDATPKEFGEFLKRDIARWKPVIAASGAKLD